MQANIITSFLGATFFSGVLLLSSVGVANAKCHCCSTHPAICQAACGKPCCGSGGKCSIGDKIQAGRASEDSLPAQKEAAKKAVKEAQAVLEALEAEERKPTREGAAPAPR